MQTITINIEDDTKNKLQQKAEKFGIKLEDLVKISIDDLLENNDNELKNIVDYVLIKNNELYQRLAK